MTDWLKMLRPKTAQQLVLNHQKQLPLKGTAGEIDFKPVCKIFSPWGGATWLLTEMDDDGIAFGLCDLGFGCPELGDVSLAEIYAVRGPGGLRIEEDLYWEADKTLRQYAKEARRLGSIQA